MSSDRIDPSAIEERDRRLLARVLSATARSAGERDTPIAPSVIIRKESNPWHDSGAPGVRYKLLWEDVDAKQRTVLYQMDAGSFYPAHVHAGTEECYVIQGDLHQEGLTMTAGDYQRVESGSQHGDQRSMTGCLLFIRCSTGDYPVRRDSE